MSGIRNLVFGCVSEQSQFASEAGAAASAMPTKRIEKVKFGVPLSEALKDDNIPVPLIEILVHIAQEGVTSQGIFRRPGSSIDQKIIVKKLMEGKQVQYADYNHYTLTGVIKKFLLKIPGGIFGPEAEANLLEVLDMPNKQDQYDRIQSVMSSLPLPTQHLLVLLFGTWFRTVNHVQYSTMSSEAIGKSVAGSMFHTCAAEPHLAERAAKVLKLMIDDFGVACLFGRNNLTYFAEITGTCLKVQEQFRYEYRYPVDDSEAIEKYLHSFAMYLQLEAKRRGFDIERDGVTEDDFLRTPMPGYREQNYEIMASSVSASPQSLPQQQLPLRESDNGFNPHRKLTQMSSVSAPDVNKLQTSPPTPKLLSSKRAQLSTSMTSFDQVKRRQFVHMKMRANWFLGNDGDATVTDAENCGVVEIGNGEPANMCIIEHQTSSENYEEKGNGDNIDGLRHAPLTRLDYSKTSPIYATHAGTDVTPVTDLKTGSSSVSNVPYQPYVCCFVVERSYGRADSQSACS